MVSETEQALGPIDLLVANAGIAGREGAVIYGYESGLITLGARAPRDDPRSADSQS